MPCIWLHGPPKLKKALEDVEKTFVAQMFGANRRNRTKRQRLPCIIDLAEHRRRVLALTMLERAKERKKKILAQLYRGETSMKCSWLAETLLRR